METRVLGQKLENLRNCSLRLQSKYPISAEILATDFDVQDIISVNLERAVQSCIDIATHIASDFDDVSGMSAASLFNELAKKKVISQSNADLMVKAVGFRNLLVHRYATIEWKRVFDNLAIDLNLLKDFAGEITKYCNI